MLGATGSAEHSSGALWLIVGFAVLFWMIPAAHHRLKYHEGLSYWTWVSVIFGFVTMAVAGSVPDSSWIGYWLAGGLPFYLWLASWAQIAGGRRWPQPAPYQVLGGEGDIP